MPYCVVQVLKHGFLWIHNLGDGLLGVRDHGDAFKPFPNTPF